MERLTGDEHFTYEGSPINRLLNDFWAWQASDLLTNSIRGALAEYIVATALDIDGTYRMNDWHEYDLKYCGKKIEVKSSAYLQSWERDRLSRISFNIYESRPFTASVPLLSSSAFPSSPSGKSRIAKILSLAAIPFMAI